MQWMPNYPTTAALPMTPICTRHEQDDKFHPPNNGQPILRQFYLRLSLQRLRYPPHVFSSSLVGGLLLSLLGEKRDPLREKRVSSTMIGTRDTHLRLNFRQRLLSNARPQSTVSMQRGRLNSRCGEHIGKQPTQSYGPHTSWQGDLVA